MIQRLSRFQRCKGNAVFGNFANSQCLENHIRITWKSRLYHILLLIIDKVLLANMLHHLICLFQLWGIDYKNNIKFYVKYELVPMERETSAIRA